MAFYAFALSSMKFINYNSFNFAMSLFFFLRFYLFIQERHTERQRHRQRDKEAPCEEPNVGLDPRTPGSRPELKADPQSLSHPGAPQCLVFNVTKNP